MEERDSSSIEKGSGVLCSQCGEQIVKGGSEVLVEEGRLIATLCDDCLSELEEFLKNGVTLVEEDTRLQNKVLVKQNEELVLLLGKLLNAKRMTHMLQEDVEKIWREVQHTINCLEETGTTPSVWSDEKLRPYVQLLHEDLRSEKG